MKNNYFQTIFLMIGKKNKDALDGFIFFKSVDSVYIYVEIAFRFIFVSDVTFEKVRK